MNSNAERELIELIKDAKPSGPRWPMVAGIGAVVVILAGIGGYALQTSAQSGPLLRSERAVLDGLVCLTTTLQRIKKVKILDELKIHTGTAIDRMTRGDFDKAKNWLATRAGR